MIAAVNGAAVTGGLEIALAADFLLGSTQAVFADTHLRVGVFPGPVLLDLPRRVGMAWARQLSLTGDFIDAETALHIGLINEMLQPELLMPRALQLASSIAENDHELVGAMRAGWAATDELPSAAAQQVWQEHSQRWRASTAAGLATRRDSVLKRSREQRA
ncbi:MAG: echA8 8 [Mycobacterium sp.]|nr:echA8 8 [Mycobacterium sp.]